jgi:ABC-type Fe3+/spermidine/putrescine transport system ATPase subunit
MVFQSYSLWPHMNVEENLRFGLGFKSLSAPEQEKRIGETLEMVQLSELRRRFPHELSGGQQQRVALARALVLKPRIILLDEPLSNLDAKLRTSLREEIRRLHTLLRITMVYVTHDQEEAFSMADRVAIMREGRILQCGTPQEIYEKPQSTFAAAFLGETNLIEGTIIVGESHRVLKTEEGLSLELSGNDAASLNAKATALIRPEKLYFGAPPSGTLSVATVQGIVKEASYFGGFERFKIDIGAQTVITLTRATNPREPHHVGEPVLLSYYPNEVVLLEAHA